MSSHFCIGRVAWEGGVRRENQGNRRIVKNTRAHMRITPKKQDLTGNLLAQVSKQIQWSQGQYAPWCSSVLRKVNKKTKFGRQLSSSNMSP